jgi:ring-1,2-phenylacetyl-CoA epoxidase subunit PaaD
MVTNSSSALVTNSPSALVESVRDPEIPVMTIGDLGIVRSVEIEGSLVIVTVTPTYSGCPAMDTIRSDIASVLADNGFDSVVRTVYSPPWTTDMISRRGRRLLQQVGIAPPGETAATRCPRCHAPNPTTLSEFGSTACKALLVCSSCREPFDLFKELK